jgi:16S rRNA (guanine1207-N2)-methyltransferase
MPDPVQQYYTYTKQEIVLRGQDHILITRPALGNTKERLTSSLLLAEHVNLEPKDQVLHLHCGLGLAGVVAARQAYQGHVTLLDCHSVAVEVARRALAANGIANAEVYLSDCGHAVQGHTFDAVLALLPKGRAVWEQTILDAAALLRVDGRLYLAGANKSGAKSAAKYASRILGDVQVLGYKGGCRIFQATKTRDDPIPQSDYYAWQTIDTQVGDEHFVYATKPGLFSWEHLDTGTRLLMEALHAHPLRQEGRVLDLGCGSGVLTLLAARQARNGTVIGVDVDCRAVEATRRTLEMNRVSNARVQFSDCTEAVEGQTFTAVVTNPPFHQERDTTYAIAEQIIRAAARVLCAHGQLYLVANSFLGYAPIIEREFGQADLLCETKSYKVWHATR